MSMTGPAGRIPEGAETGSARRTLRTRIGFAAAGVIVLGLLLGGCVVLGWMVDETHFDRPSAAFDELEARIEQLPGVEGVEKERWVEAPSFWVPTSWMSVTVDESGLPGLLAAVCAARHPDPIMWSVNVHTDAASIVSLHADPTAPSTSDADAPCPDFGFDVEPVVAELSQIAPGLSVQPAVWENGRFALVALEEEMPMGLTHLLPLVEHADELLAAAGIAPDASVEINASSLGVVIDAGTSPDYLALLEGLSARHGVRSVWADVSGAPADVQISAPGANHADIEAAIRSSGLWGADPTVRFLEE